MKLNQVGNLFPTPLNTLICALATVATLDVFCSIKPVQAASIELIGLSDNNSLVYFNPNTPSQTRSIGVTGVTGTLLGIDFRPANDLLYGVTDTNNIYTIDPTTGMASFVGSLSVPFTGGQASGFDFNPIPDRLRLVGSNDQNFRINVDTGAVIVDGTLAYAAGDVNAGADPNITAVAYTNSFAPSPAPGRPTQLFGIDSVLDILVLQNPPNNGTLNTIGSLGIDFGATGAFDILSTGLGMNTAFAASGSTLYSINLGTGAATTVGTIGGNVNIVGIASRTVPEPSTVISLMGFGALALCSRFRRYSR